MKGLRGCNSLFSKITSMRSTYHGFYSNIEKLVEIHDELDNPIYVNVIQHYHRAVIYLEMDGFINEVIVHYSSNVTYKGYFGFEVYYFNNMTQRTLWTKSRQRGHIDRTIIPYSCYWTTLIEIIRCRYTWYSISKLRRILQHYLLWLRIFRKKKILYKEVHEQLIAVVWSPKNMRNFKDLGVDVDYFEE